MKNFTYTRALVWLAAVTLAACSQTIQAKPNTLTAVKVSQAPSDGASPVWDKAPILELATTRIDQNNAPPGPTLSLQAVYDAGQVAIRAEWSDPTQSVYKNAWTWDGSKFSRDGDEDRLMIHFPMSNDAEFATKGCAAACHNQENNPEQWYMATNNAEMRYDQWHWKSTRSNPVGQADDKWLGIQQNPNDTESAHYPDAQESGGETRNENDRRNGPAFMHGTNPDSAYILTGEEQPIDTTSLASGAIIPGYILSAMVGSRGDLTAQGLWSDGRWVVVIRRALDTSHEDDIVFTPPKLVPFGVALVDNGGGYEHAVVEEVLTLEWR